MNKSKIIVNISLKPHFILSVLNTEEMVKIQLLLFFVLLYFMTHLLLI